MSYLFANCTDLEEIPDISKWNTSNVKYMQGMFMNCESLESLPDISKWDTHNVRLMGGYFSGLSLLTDNDAFKLEEKGQSFDLAGMFYGCKRINSIPQIGILPMLLIWLECSGNVKKFLICLIFQNGILPM